MMMQMIQGLGKRMEKIQENFTTELEVVQNVNNLLAMRDTWVQSLGQEDSLKEGMETPLVFFTRELHGQRSLAGYSSWGHKESDLTE